MANKNKYGRIENTIPVMANPLPLSLLFLILNKLIMLKTSPAKDKRALPVVAIPAKSNASNDTIPRVDKPNPITASLL
ncbi:MAG: hypothetical protein U0V04_13285 [Spirosomataceae bacterium]